VHPFDDAEASSTIASIPTFFGCSTKGSSFRLYRGLPQDRSLANITYKTKKTCFQHSHSPLERSSARNVNWWVWGYYMPLLVGDYFGYTNEEGFRNGQTPHLTLFSFHRQLFWLLFIGSSRIPFVRIFFLGGRLRSFPTGQSMNFCRFSVYVVVFFLFVRDNAPDTHLLPDIRNGIARSRERDLAFIGTKD
jgi:hypothetical protein